jgi:UDP-N-acetyl-D-mannosaminuronate dehydrogenase
LERVCVIGLGTVGYPSAQNIHQKGFPVSGVDIRPLNIKEFPVSTIIPPSDIYVVCVDTKSVEDVCGKIGKGSLVIIESTIPVGLSRKLAQKYSLKMAHCPHRYWPEDPAHHGVQQMRVLGAVDMDALNKAEAFYKRLGVPLHIVSNIEVAELAKLTENTYRFVEIAFAEELRLVADELNVPFEALREAVNTKWNIKILEARDGINGTCLPKDRGIFESLTSNDKHFLVEGAAKADAVYKKWVSNKKSQ